LTTSAHKLDELLQQTRAAAKTLADELEYALELVREEESVEVDLQQLIKNWNRARTELAMAVFGEPTLPEGGIDACEKAIAARRRYADLESEISRAQGELRYLEQSPAGLVQDLADLITCKREQVELLEAELAALAPLPATTPPPPVPPAAPAPAPTPKTSPQPAVVPAQHRPRTTQPKKCGVCLSTRGNFKLFEDRWRCSECFRLENEIASARRSLAALNARPLDQSVSPASEVPGVAKIRAQGREAMYVLAARRPAAGAGAQPQRSQAPRKQAGQVKRQAAASSVDDLKQRWNTRK